MARLFSLPKILGSSNSCADLSQPAKQPPGNRSRNSKSSSKPYNYPQNNNVGNNDRNMPEKEYVNTHKIQNALQSFLNQHRSFLQNLEEQNQKLAHDNSNLNAELNKHEGTIIALNEIIAAGKQEIAKYKQEQLHAMENKKLLRAELMETKKRCGKIIISWENAKIEMQQRLDELENKLKERDDKEAALENKLDVIRQELQTKMDECAKGKEELALIKTELKVSKAVITEQEKSITTLTDELKTKNEAVEKLRKEYEEYKIETEKNINKMQEVQRIIYPNTSNPLPRTNQSNDNRITQPTTTILPVRPIREKPALRATSRSSSSSSDSDSEIEAGFQGEIQMQWAPRRFRDDSGTEQPSGFNNNRRSEIEISETPDSSHHGQQQRRKRRRHH